MVFTTLLTVVPESTVVVVVVVVFSALWLVVMTLVFVERVDPDPMFTIEGEGEFSIYFHFAK
jgi:hypothetical protein